eukprot:12549619-Alexandrium_andersonii.AAC.1
MASVYLGLREATVRPMRLGGHPAWMHSSARSAMGGACAAGSPMQTCLAAWRCGSRNLASMLVGVACQLSHQGTRDLRGRGEMPSAKSMLAGARV